MVCPFVRHRVPVIFTPPLSVAPFAPPLPTLRLRPGFPQGWGVVFRLGRRGSGGDAEQRGGGRGAATPGGVHLLRGESSADCGTPKRERGGRDPSEIAEAERGVCRLPSSLFCLYFFFVFFGFCFWGAGGVETGHGNIYVCLCMYVCMYAYMYVCMYIRMCVIGGY